MSHNKYHPTTQSDIDARGCIATIILILGVTGFSFFYNKTQTSRNVPQITTPKTTAILDDRAITEHQDWLDAQEEQYLAERNANAEEAYAEIMATEQAQYALEAAAEAKLHDSLLEDLADSCPYTNRDSNLRAGPGTNYPVIGFAPKDSCIPVDGRNSNGTWLVFHDDNEFGAGVDVWIAASLIGDEPQDLPVVTAQAAPAASLQEAAPANASAPNCAGGCTEYPSWCAPPIKGNVSQNTGERIYHLLGQEYYDATNISPDYGERWFCTEDEAVAAGWRRSRR